MLQELFSLDRPSIFVRLIGGEWRLLEDNDAIDDRFENLRSETLWEGTWSSGNLTVEGISNYELFIFSVDTQGSYTGFPMYAYKNYFGITTGSSGFQISGVGGSVAGYESGINPKGIVLAALNIKADGDVLNGDERGAVTCLASTIALNQDGSLAKYDHAVAITKIVGVKMVAP